MYEALGLRARPRLLQPRPQLLHLGDEEPARVLPPGPLEHAGEVVVPELRDPPQVREDPAFREYLVRAQRVLDLVGHTTRPDELLHDRHAALLRPGGGGPPADTRPLPLLEVVELAQEAVEVHPVGEAPLPHLQRRDDAPEHHLLPRELRVEQPGDALGVRLDAAHEEDAAGQQGAVQLPELADEPLAHGEPGPGGLVPGEGRVRRVLRRSAEYSSQVLIEKVLGL
mmetsp:Transcript_42908/g.121398  ORF Transcript_42908/g.121398 Transcript_42908/m.121398 type:complete len:226 (+) Transcript_42908:1474-2151(+)